MSIARIPQTCGEARRSPSAQFEFFRRGRDVIVGFIARALFQTAYFVLVARALGADQFGAFAATLAVVSVISPFATLGAPNVILAETTLARRSFPDFLGAGLFSVVGATIVGLAFVISTSRLVHFERATLILILAVLAAELCASRIVDIGAHAYMAFGRSRASAAAIVSLTGLRALTAIVFFASGERDAETWAIWYFAASVVSAVIVLFAVMHGLGRPRLSRVALLRLLRTGPFFAVGTASQTVYADADKALLARLGSLSLAGAYTSAYRLVTLGSLPVIAGAFSASPFLFKCARDTPEELWATVARFLKGVLPFAIAAGLLLVVGAPLLPRVIGASYSSAVPMIRWLAVLPAIQAVHVLCGQALMACGAQSSRSAVQMALAVLNAAACAALIPIYSWRGAALATLIGEGLLAISMAWLLRRTITSTVGMRRAAIAAVGDAGT